MQQERAWPVGLPGEMTTMPRMRSPFPCASLITRFTSSMFADQFWLSSKKYGSIVPPYNVSAAEYKGYCGMGTMKASFSSVMSSSMRLCTLPDAPSAQRKPAFDQKTSLATWKSGNLHCEDTRRVSHQHARRTSWTCTACTACTVCMSKVLVPVQLGSKCQQRAKHTCDEDEVWICWVAVTPSDPLRHRLSHCLVSHRCRVRTGLEAAGELLRFVDNIGGEKLRVVLNQLHASIQLTRLRPVCVWQ